MTPRALALAFWQSAPRRRRGYAAPPHTSAKASTFNSRRRRRPDAPKARPAGARAKCEAFRAKARSPKDFGRIKGLSKKPPLCGPIGVLGLAWLSRARGCGMAMGVLRGQESTLQVAIVCLDELVPEDCRYRKLDRLVDWTFVREAASPYYADEVGRPSVDPIVLVKLLVAGALEGIGSARELCRVAGL